MHDNGTQGVVEQLSISRGGVPKLPTPGVRIGAQGIEGDGHNDTKHHGGPDQAVCLFSMEIIERLKAEGHPVAPGTTGENITIRGLDWSLVTPGSRLVFDGGVALEVTKYTTPCSTIRASFTDSEFRRIHQDDHPGESRVYARVLTGGEARAGETVTLHRA
ncbi:MAG: MOSC domain-containing protein [Phycisphaeraceae bacterium]|nr:MOSC domain-containing protein [Phycisphaeraceae bacterium]MCB9847404.1 MOSC domain-containing protein [Phycisphaeraceae bacterium]